MRAALRVGAWVPVTRTEGPGARFAVWLQGCSIRCPGCCNPQLFDPAGGAHVSVSRLLKETRAVRDEIEGVTLLGGEPFEQAEGLAAYARGARGLGLSVMTFSGYTLEELRRNAASRPAVGELLAATDVLVDGPYEVSRPEPERLWVGSTNQRFHYLTSRYTDRIEHPDGDEPLRGVEVHIGADGRLHANGWPVFQTTRPFRLG
jgi:anaerobic ribonucleoside-triphosphate reductase activating protein